MAAYPIDDFTPAQLKEYQSQKVREAVFYAYANSPYYRKLFDTIGLRPSHISGIDDLSKIPITTRDQVYAAMDSFIAAPKERWRRIFSTAGISGKPIYFPYTEKDLRRMSHLMQRSLHMVGLTKDDTTQLTLQSDRLLWIARTAIVGGHREIGDVLMTFGSTSLPDQLSMMKQFKVSVIHGIPSFLLKIGRYAERYDIRPRLLLCTAESIIEGDLTRNVLGEKLGKLFPTAKIISTYYNSETVLAASESGYENGHHIPPEAGYVEIVDPKTGQPVKDGEMGALVITAFDVEGLPLLRYMVGDITFLLPGKSKSGRVIQRMGPVIGSLGTAVRINNIIIYPSAFANLVYSIDDIYEYYVRAYQHDGKEAVELYITPAPWCSIEGASKAAADLKNRVMGKFGFSVPVKILNQSEIKERILDKHCKVYSRFIDERPHKPVY